MLKSAGRLTSLALAGVLATALAGCTDDSSADGSGASAPAASSGDARQLKGVCPDVVTVQTSWYPESTHGGLFQLYGSNYKVDSGKKSIRGPLISKGVDTGVQLEIRAGGPAAGNQPISALMTTDKSIMLGQQATEEQVLGWASNQPTTAVIAPFEVDPVVFMWDKAKHPDFNLLQDIGLTDTTVLTYRSANIDYLLGAGILRASQIDYGYDGSPQRLATDRRLVVGGFSTNEPYIYRTFMKIDVGYQYVSESGYPDYRNMLVVRPETKTSQAACLKKLVPILQQGMVDFMAKPDPVLNVITKVNKEYKAPFEYSVEQGKYGVETMKKDGLVANPTSMRDAAFGSLDPNRVKRMIEILVPIYNAQKKPVPAGVTPDSLATNEFLDKSIRLPNS